MAATSSDQPITTLALRGICKTYTLETVFEILNAACGSTNAYDFVHFPKRGEQQHGGLVIVNFIDPHSCRTCLQNLLKMREDGVFTGVKSIAPSYIQGFAQNLAYYSVLLTEGMASSPPMIFALASDQRKGEPIGSKAVTPRSSAMSVTSSALQAKAYMGLGRSDQTWSEAE
eukprot:Skav233670  [mRNA]  locus=scaffold976:203113:205588:- [translate_table: standard]